MSKYSEVVECIHTGRLVCAVMALQQITGVGLNTASNVVWSFRMAAAGVPTAQVVSAMTSSEYFLFNNLRHS